jgi:hypothetical protein
MKNPITMNFMLFISFLMIGYSVSTKFYHPSYAFSSGSSLSISTNSNSIQALKNGQHNFMLILVDTLDPYKANLESLWLITNLPPDATLQVFPIYPTGSESITAFENQLLHSFKLDNKNDSLTIDQATIKFLEENNYWWSGYFIIESDSLSIMLDTLTPTLDFGEIAVKDEYVSDQHGEENDPQNMFSYQLAQMQTICNRLSEISQNPTSISDILTNSKKLATNLEPAQLEIELKKLISTKQQLNCTFPTLEISQINK